MIWKIKNNCNIQLLKSEISFVRNLPEKVVVHIAGGN